MREAQAVFLVRSGLQDSLEAVDLVLAALVATAALSARELAAVVVVVVVVVLLLTSFYQTPITASPVAWPSRAAAAAVTEVTAAQSVVTA